MKSEFSIEEKVELLQLARKTITSYLTDGTKESETTKNEKFKQERGVFVTLNNKKELRGCIGYPFPIRPLTSAVMDNIIAAATNDPRFSSVTLEELGDIDIEISILTIPKQVKDTSQVVLGQDGIIISKGVLRGLLLPQVPVEQGWNLEEYLSYGCMKAGLPKDEWQQEGVKIETFQADVFSENNPIK